jgi:medium-chain acyl-[acyl-carrier-protein] hydrolase
MMSTLSSAAPWITRPRPRPGATLRLFFFPHAGVGPSVFVPWANALPPTIEGCIVQLAGREGRFKEPALRTLREVVEGVKVGIEPWLDKPFAFFGHSLGALIAFEVARKLGAIRGVHPCHLFVSGRRAPQVADREPPIAHLADEAFLSALERKYGPIRAEVRRDPELLALFLPTLKADVAVLESYLHEPGDRLPCHVSAYWGGDDRQVSAEMVGPWADVTTGAFDSRRFEGGHFYLLEQRATVLDGMLAALEGRAS